MDAYYFIGIAGTAMASVAVETSKNFGAVWGSDNNIYPPASTLLADSGIRVSSSYRESNVEAFLAAFDPGRVTFVVGNAISRGNPELEYVLDRRLAYTSLPEFVGTRLIGNRRSICICGTHGKTTTSALLSTVLDAIGAAPGFLVGGVPLNFSSGCRSAAEDGLFVVEGDEYDSAYFDKRPKFLHYRPYIAAINNVEFDHADIYRSLEDILVEFRRLVQLIPRSGALVFNGDDVHLPDVARSAHCRSISFGFGASNDVRAEIAPAHDGSTVFSVASESALKLPVDGTYSLPLAGAHNVRNALAVIVTCALLGYDARTIASGISAFNGVRRRIEIVGEARGITLIDDFAHHPTAIRETLRAISGRYPGRRIVALFEPRSNTTTRSVFQDELAVSFDAANVIHIAPVHRPERYPPDQVLSPEKLAHALRAQGKHAVTAPDIPALARTLLAELRDGDVVVMLSNGSFGGIRRTLWDALRS